MRMSFGEQSLVEVVTVTMDIWYNTATLTGKLQMAGSRIPVYFVQDS